MFYNRVKLSPGIFYKQIHTTYPLPVFSRVVHFHAVPTPGYIIQDFVQSAMTHKNEHDGTLNPAEH